MKVLAAFLATCLWLVTSVSFAYSPVEAVSTMPAVAMRTEGEMEAFLDLKRQNDYGAAWRFLRKSGLFLGKGTQVILTGSGCDGECVRFRVKGQEEEFWALPIVDGQKVFEYKKSE